MTALGKYAEEGLRGRARLERSPGTGRGASCRPCPRRIPRRCSRRFGLSDAHAEVLLDRDSLSYMPVALGVVGPSPRPRGVPRGWGRALRAYGADLREFISRINQPMFLNLLAQEWFPAVPAWSSGCKQIHLPGCSTWAAGPAGPPSPSPAATRRRPVCLRDHPRHGSCRRSASHVGTAGPGRHRARSRRAGRR